MALVNLIMPKMGESITEATILKWLKKPGDMVEVDEAILEIATDKVDSEVPATDAGILGEYLFAEGDVVEVGKTLAVINTDASTSSTEAAAPAATAPIVENTQPEIVASKEAEIVEAEIAQTVEAVSTPANGARFYSPLVLNIARQEGISMVELEAIAGTGADDRVTKRDVLNFVSNRKNSSSSNGAAAKPAMAATPAAATPAATPAFAPAKSISGDVEIIEMDRMRSLIAKNMVASKQISPHVTSFVEVDVTPIVLWREKWKQTLEKREGQKLTYTPIFIDAIVKAIKDFPMINISLEGDKIIRKKYINIGMAAALPSGNLIVPVIKNADQLNMLGLVKQVNDLANRARTGKLKPEEIQDGTYTISNVGTFGNVMGTPIIPQPQVAIMAVGAIKKKPVVIETAQGDQIAIRHMMMISHSYDHRIVDGALGGMFARRVADYLEQWDMNKSI